MPILVVGATSQIGYFLLARLQLEKQPVLALSRKAMREAGTGVHWLQGDIEKLEARGDLRAIASFGPMDGVARWLERHRHAPAPCLVATSSMSVLTKSDSAIVGECLLASRLAAGEAAIKAQCERLGMRWTLLRPTLIYGAARDRSLTPIARRATRCKVFPLPVGRGLRQPVHADDLAQIMLSLIRKGQGAGLTLQVGGGERLQAGEMFRRVRAALPVRTLPVPLPAAVMGGLALAMPPLRGPVSRLGADLVADNGPLLDLLGFRPRDFQLQPWMLGVGNDWAQRLAMTAGGR